MVRGKAVEQCLWRGWKEKQDKFGRWSLEREVKCLRDVRRKICILSVTWTALLESEEAKIMENGKKVNRRLATINAMREVHTQMWVHSCTLRKQESKSQMTTGKQRKGGKRNLSSILAWAMGWGVFLSTEWGKVCWAE